MEINNLHYKIKLKKKKIMINNNSLQKKMNYKMMKVNIVIQIMKVIINNNK
jgi:hypothetical protein